MMAISLVVTVRIVVIEDNVGTVEIAKVVETVALAEIVVIEWAGADQDSVVLKGDVAVLIVVQAGLIEALV